MRSARMARNEGRGLTPADKQADEKAHAHGNQHGLGGFFLHVFFTRFVKLLGLVTDDFSLFLGVVADGAGLFRSRLADLVYFSRGESPGLLESGDGKLAGEGQEQEVSFAAAVVSSSVWLSCMVD